MITPGPQKPHCSEPFSSNAFWMGWRRSCVASPSIVRTSRPSACPASIRHEFTSLPSTITVQAPQSPTSQPSLAPVRLKLSRRSLRSVVSDGTDAVRCSPLTFMLTVTINLPFLGCLALLLREVPRPFERALREHGDEVAAILRRRAHVVNRLRVAGGEAAGFRHRIRRDLLAREELLRASGANDLRRHRAQRHARFAERRAVPSGVPIR